MKSHRKWLPRVHADIQNGSSHGLSEAQRAELAVDSVLLILRRQRKRIKEEARAPLAQKLLRVLADGYLTERDLGVSRASVKHLDPPSLARAIQKARRQLSGQGYELKRDLPWL